MITSKSFYTNLMILFFISVAIFITPNLYGSAFSLGNLSSVVSEGPFDAGRNPALMTGQKKDHAIGLAYFYESYIIGDSSIYNDMDSPDNLTLKIEADDPVVSGMSGHFGYSVRAGGTVIGFVVTEGEESQYSTSEAESRVTITDLDNSTNIYIHSIQDIEKMNPSLALSIGIMISEKDSIGFQIISDYYYSKKISIDDSYSDIAPSAHRETKKELISNTISGEIGFGYMYADKTSQIGLLVRSGRASWKKDTLSLDVIDISSLPSSQTIDNKVSESSELPLFGIYSRGVNITAGGYKRLFPFIAIALEGFFRFENTYIHKEIDYIQDESASELTFLLEERKYPQKIDNQYLVKGGVEFNPTRFLSMSFGAGYTSFYLSEYWENNDTTRNRIMRDGEVDVYYFTGGLDFNFGENLNLILFASLINYNSTEFYYSGEEYQSGTENLYKESVVISKMEFNILDLGIGLNLLF